MCSRYKHIYILNSIFYSDGFQFQFGTTFIKLMRLAYKSASLSKFNALCKHELHLSYFSVAKDHGTYKSAKCTQASNTQS